VFNTLVIVVTVLFFNKTNQMGLVPNVKISVLHLHSEPIYVPSVTITTTSFFILNSESKPVILVKSIVGVVRTT
jgi:hypothetical protein